MPLSPTKNMMRIPKRKREYHLDDADVSKQSSALPNKPQEINKKNINNNVFWKSRELMDKHGNSKADEYGNANLFFEFEGQKNLLLFELRKRCISSEDCVDGRTYMDTTSFGDVMKSDQCPLVAFSVDDEAKACNKAWRKGYVVKLCVKETVILGVSGEDSFEPHVIRLKPMDKDNNLKIIYINLVDESMDSTEDRFLVSKTTGPDMIHISNLPEFAQRIKRDEVEELLRIPPLQQLTDRRPSRPLQMKEKIEAEPKRKTYLVKELVEVPNASANDNNANWKNNIAFMSPDDKKTLYMIPIAKAKEIVKRGEIEREEFLGIIKREAVFTTLYRLLEVSSFGLAISQSRNKEGFEEKSLSYGRGKEVSNLNDDIIAMYSLYRESLTVDAESFKFLVHHVTNGHSRDRSSNRCIGTNWNHRINQSHRPRIDPRKDSVALMKSDFFVSSRMDPTFAPLLRFIVDKLAVLSNGMSSAFDPVAHYAYKDIYQEILQSEEERNQMKYNLTPEMGKSSLQILTFPDKNGVNFANGGHIDQNDANAEAFNAAMANKIESSFRMWLDKLALSKSQNARNHCLKNIKAVLYLMERGLNGDELLNPSDERVGKYTTNTTCAYNVIYKPKDDSKREERTVMATFCYPKNNIAVQLPVNRLLFQYWDSNRVFHFTPIAFTFDSKKVYLKDRDLVVLAWGAGSSKRVDFLAEHGINYHTGGIRSTRQLCEIMQAHNATNDVVQAAAQRFPHHQTFITNYFQ